MSVCRGSEASAMGSEAARAHVHNLLHNPQITRQLSGEQQEEPSTIEKQVQSANALLLCWAIGQLQCQNEYNFYLNRMGSWHSACTS